MIIKTKGLEKEFGFLFLILGMLPFYLIGQYIIGSIYNFSTIEHELLYSFNIFQEKIIMLSNIKYYLFIFSFFAIIISVLFFKKDNKIDKSESLMCKTRIDFFYSILLIIFPLMILFSIIGFHFLIDDMYTNVKISVIEEEDIEAIKNLKLLIKELFRYYIYYCIFVLITFLFKLIINTKKINQKF